MIIHEFERETATVMQCKTPFSASSYDTPFLFSDWVAIARSHDLQGEDSSASGFALRRRTSQIQLVLNGLEVMNVPLRN